MHCFYNHILDAASDQLQKGLLWHWINISFHPLTSNLGKVTLHSCFLIISQIHHSGSGSPCEATSNSHRHGISFCPLKRQICLSKMFQMREHRGPRGTESIDREEEAVRGTVKQGHLRQTGLKAEGVWLTDEWWTKMINTDRCGEKRPIKAEKSHSSKSVWKYGGHGRRRAWKHMFQFANKTVNCYEYCLNICGLCTSLCGSSSEIILRLPS